MSLREKFETAYAEGTIEQIDAILTTSAKSLKAQLTQVIESERAKDPSSSVPHTGYFEIARFDATIEPHRVLNLKGFYRLLQACARKDIDMKLMISVPPETQEIGFRHCEKPSFKVLIDMNESFDKSPQAAFLGVPESATISVTQGEKPRYRLTSTGLAPSTSTLSSART